MPTPQPILSVAVLAAGEGTRMHSALPKVLHPICGRPMLRLVLDIADALQPQAAAVVLAPDTIARVSAEFGQHYQYVVQAERLGTAHALLQARPALQQTGDYVLVLYGDTPLLRPETCRMLAMAAAGRRMALLSFTAEPPTGFGRVVRDLHGQPVRIVEERNASAEERLITEAVSGIFCFEAGWLWETLPKLERNALRGEYYLTDLVAWAVRQDGPEAVAAVTSTSEEAWGINDRAQLAVAEAILRRRLLEALMQRGVTIHDPQNTYVDVGVQVGQDAILHPGTVLRGATVIGPGCEVGPHVRVQNATLGARCRVQFAVIENTVLPEGTDAGPFQHITS